MDTTGQPGHSGPALSSRSPDIVTCQTCGHRNPDGDEFCGSCGGYLNWVGEPDGPAVVAEPMAAAAPGTPAPQLPGEAAAPLPVSPAPVPRRVVRHGDLICGDCGEGNVPTRRFCSRCGAPLTEAEHAHVSWYRRLAQRRGRRLAARAAVPGGAPRPRRSVLRAAVRWARRLLVVAVVAAAVLYGAAAPVRGWVNTHVTRAARAGIERVHPHFTPVHPVRVTGTRTVGANGPQALSDGSTATYWAARESDHPTVTMYFQQPVDLSRILIHNGITGNLQAADRPSTLRLTYSTGHHQDLRLDDTDAPQQRSLSPGGLVTSVQFSVPAVNRSGSNGLVAITEIELYGRRQD